MASAIDDDDPLLVASTALLAESRADLTQEQRAYYVQYLSLYGYPFDPNNPYRHMQEQAAAAVAPVAHGAPLMQGTSLLPQQQGNGVQAAMLPQMGGQGGGQFYGNAMRAQPAAFQPRFNAAPAPQQHQMRKPSEMGVKSPVLWIGQLAPGTSRNDLVAALSQVATPLSVRVLDQKSCAFADFDSAETTGKVIDALHGTQINGAYIRVGYGKDSGNRPRQPMPDMGGGGGGGGGFGGGHGGGFGGRSEDNMPPSTNLWVGNIADEVTADMLSEAFGQHGEVKRVNVLEHKGCAFVTYYSLDEAMKARQLMNGSQLCGRTMRVNFGKPEVGSAVTEKPPKQHESLVQHVMLSSGPPPAKPPINEQLRERIDLLAQYAGKSHADFIKVCKDRHGDDTDFAFFKKGELGHKYYQWRVHCEQNPGYEEKRMAQHEEELRKMREMEQAPTMMHAPSHMRQAEQPPLQQHAPPPQQQFNVVPMAPGATKPDPRAADPLAHRRALTEQLQQAKSAPPVPPPAAAQPLPLTADDAKALFDILHALKPTKESIEGARQWVVDRVVVIDSILAQMVQHALMASATEFTYKLTTLYLLNDLVSHGLKLREAGAPDGDLLLAGIHRHMPGLVPAFLHFDAARPVDAGDRDKVVKVVRQWANKGAFTSADIEHVIAMPPPRVGGAPAPAAASPAPAGGPPPMRMHPDRLRSNFSGGEPAQKRSRYGPS